MKTLLTTFNAKYIHTSLALRWLYVINKDKFDIDFVEFTIKEDAEKVADSLLTEKPDVIGISVSIWNVEKSRELATHLKQKKPKIIIILGGPEVSYEPQYFIDNWDIDFVISGEGEFVLSELLRKLVETRHATSLKLEMTHQSQSFNKLEENHIPGVSFKNHINSIIAQADITELVKYPSPYQLERDVEDLRNRMVYFESSRGCPYQCQYCLSSLERGVRYFPMDYIAENLSYLIDKPTKQIKFLDRTFNLNKKHTHQIFDLLIDKHRSNLSIQFEIYADLMKDEDIAYINQSIPKDYFRFEIGIQSTYEPTNIAVKRKQNFSLLANNIRKLMEGGKVDMHLDLIAGLPHENFDRFVQSFNDVFQLKAKEVQLGFLKLLRGTNLRKQANLYGYIYQEEAPYELISSKDISESELNRIRDAEHALEKFWNSGRFKRTMDYLFDNQYKDRYFELFDEIGQFYNLHHLPHFGYQLEDLYRNLDKFLQTNNINAYEQLRYDYYDNFSMRPSRFWKEELTKAERKTLLYQIGQDKAFLKQHGLTRKIIEKQTAIHRLDSNRFLLIIFLRQGDNENYLRIIYNL